MKQSKTTFLLKSDHVQTQKAEAEVAADQEVDQV